MTLLVSKLLLVLVRLVFELGSRAIRRSNRMVLLRLRLCGNTNIGLADNIVSSRWDRLRRFKTR